MFDIFFCIRDQHNLWLVALAARVCVIASVTAILLLRHARDAKAHAAPWWTLAAGAATGFGIWATHFIAMLGYDTGVVAGYDLPTTAASLLIAIAMMSLCFGAALRCGDRRGLALAAVLGGGGIAAMHYCGMAALRLPATLHWRGAYVAASLVLAMGAMYPALALGTRGKSLSTGLAASAMMALGVVLVHFAGMTGLVLLPGPPPAQGGTMLSPAAMAVLVGAGSVVVAMLCLAVLIVSFRARAALRTREKQLDAALSNMHQGLCLFDPGGRLLLVNDRFRQIWQLDEEQCRPGISVMQLGRAAQRGRIGAEPTEQRLATMRDLLRQSLASPGSPPVIAEFGEALVVSIASRPLPDGGWVSTFEDITEQRRSQRQIAHMALHDHLTGLANRSLFNQWLDTEMAQAVHGGRRLAVVVIDLDRFKDINDTHGHGTGDATLQMLARRLESARTDAEMVARLGGDEFAAAKPFCDDAEVTDFLNRLLGCFAAPFGDAEADFALGGSLGVALFPGDGGSREQLLNNASLAMHRAKGAFGPSGAFAGKTGMSERIAYYEPGMDETARARRLMAADLRHAIDRGELSLLYQPQHDLETGAMIGHEALLRWQNPRLGAVSPDVFIPLAEETGEIFRIGEWVLRQAAFEAKSWSEPLMIAVNLSAVQLLKPDLAETVTRILLETGLSPRRLELEITETAIIADKARALHSLRQIKALGVSIAMDDFGTGYSSLDTLHSFPFDKIKIDKSFLRNAHSSPQARAIIRTVLALGRSLHVPVLAEGVETQDQLDLLRGEGCAQVQGYFFGRPTATPCAHAPMAAAR